jgi:hypothetical protein
MTPLMLPAMLLGAIAATKPGPTTTSVPLPASVDGRATILHLVNRSEVVTITAGPSGPLYSATTQDGKVLVSGATLDQLREQQPDVYKRLHPTITVAADAAPVVYADLAAR